MRFHWTITQSHKAILPACHAVLLALPFMWVAFWNGFPTVYPDSATYMECGFLLETPVDRPITYGLFIALTSFFGTSLWLTVFAQCLLLAVTTRAFVRLFLPRLWLLPTLFVALLSSVSFLSSQVMTDIFTSIMVMSAILFALSERRRFVWLVCFVVCCAMHASHLPLVLLLYPFLAAAVAFISRTSFGAAWKRTSWILLGTGIAYIALNISMVKSGQAFYAAHLAETGDLQEYLSRACPTRGYDLCHFPGSIPESAEFFLWNENSVTRKYNSREHMKTDLGRIIQDMLWDPRSRTRVIKSTLKFGWSQLGMFAIGEGNVPYPPGSAVHDRVLRFFANDRLLFEGMRQNTPNRFNPLVSSLNWWYTILAVVAAMICCMSTLAAFRLRAGLVAFGIQLVLVAYAINCYTNAGLVLVANRFGAKLVWLLPLMAAIGLCWIFTRTHMLPHNSPLKAATTR